MSTKAKSKVKATIKPWGKFWTIAAIIILIYSIVVITWNVVEFFTNSGGLCLKSCRPTNILAYILATSALWNFFAPVIAISNIYFIFGHNIAFLGSWLAVPSTLIITFYIGTLIAMVVQRITFDVKLPRLVFWAHVIPIPIFLLGLLILLVG